MKAAQIAPLAKISQETSAKMIGTTDHESVIS
jgi:hypothetical protein